VLDGGEPKERVLEAASAAAAATSGQSADPDEQRQGVWQPRVPRGEPLRVSGGGERVLGGGGRGQRERRHPSVRVDGRGRLRRLQRARSATRDAALEAQHHPARLPRLPPRRRHDRPARSQVHGHQEQEEEHRRG
jgi:hypothetical protein